MPAPWRTQIITAALARFAAIRKTAGYRTDAGLRLRAWQASPPKWEELPVLVVSDPSDKLGWAHYGARIHALELVVELFLPGGVPLETLREYAADLLQAAGVDETWGWLATASEPESITLEPGDADRVSAGVRLGLTIRGETGLWET